MFERLARWADRSRWWAIAAWVVVLVGVTLAAQAVGASYRNDFSLPGTESQAALDALRQHAPVQAGATVQIVLQHGNGLAAPPARERVETMLAEVRALPHVAQVTSPYTDPSMISRDQTIGYALVTLDGQTQDVPAEAVRAVACTAQTAADDGLQVELGGEAIREVQENEGGPAEGVGLLAALVILALLFGSLLAASLPIAIAITWALTMRCCCSRATAASCAPAPPARRRCAGRWTPPGGPSSSPAPR